jgi:hypothetical protein
MIRIGDLKRKTAKVPVFLPLDVLNGLCFESNEQTRDNVLRQMQYMAMSLQKKVSSDMLHLTFIDIGLNTQFPMLHSLNTPNIKFITSNDKLKQFYLFYTQENTILHQLDAKLESSNLQQLVAKIEDTENKNITISQQVVDEFKAPLISPIPLI